MSDVSNVIDYYNANADGLAKRYAAQKPETLHARLIEILDEQKPEGEILEIGAGIARDAIFFGERYESTVYAIEPSHELIRQCDKNLQSNGYKKTSAYEFPDEMLVVCYKGGRKVTVCSHTLDEMAQEWLEGQDDGAESKYAFINVNAVWQHIPLEKRAEAASNLSKMLLPGGIISIKGRNKPSPEQMGIAWDVTAAELCDEFAGLEQVFVEEQPDFSRPGSDLKFISTIFRRPFVS